MIEYNYCDKDLLRYPEKYQMSAYAGIQFLYAYFLSRKNVLKSLDVNNNVSFDEFIINKFIIINKNDDQIITEKHLSCILVRKINKMSKDQDDIDLDIFLRKFEIKKKIFTEYNKEFKEKTENYFELKNYILLAANFIVAYQQTTNLKYLNVCLKLNDLIISNLHKIEGECFRILFLLVLRKELDCINELCTKKGVKI